MAMKLIEGFDDNLFAQRGWSAMQLAAGRFGGNAGQAIFFGNPYYPFPVAITGTLVVGVACFFSVSPPYANMLTVGPIVLKTNISGNVTLNNGATLVATSAANPFVAPNVWRYIEVKYLMATGACTVRCDGVTITSGTVATAASVSTIGYGLGNGNSGNLLWDDIYVLDGTGTTNNDFLGDVRVQTLYPNGDGSNSGLTTSSGSTHNTLVNETTPNTTTYVYGTTSGLKDTYAFQDLDANTANVFAVETAHYSHKDAVGSVGFSNVARVGSTDYVATAQPLSVSWTTNRDIWETNPATGVAWAPSDVNSAEFGVQTS
ncbi:MAG: hypothetical protein ABIR37_04130 [Candidatus Saccharimonadales bacterium]